MIVYIQRSSVPTHLALDKVLVEAGLELRYFRFFFFPIKRGVVFIRFPDEVVDTPLIWKMLVKFCAFLFSITATKLLGSHIAWEINNVKSHERRYPLFETTLMAVLTYSVTGVIHNSKSAAREAIVAYPSLNRAQGIVAPESNFRHVYPLRGDPILGRRVLGLNEGDTALLIFGLVRRYKGADKLIELVKQVAAKDLRLIIAGKAVDRPYAAELQRAAQSDPRIKLIFQTIPDEQVPHIYAAATLACAPFRAVLNSASVLLALSCGCPVIAARLGTMPDLEEYVGPDWLMLYDGDLNLHTLEKAITWARLPRPTPPALEFCDFATVASDILAFLIRIGSTQ